MTIVSALLASCMDCDRDGCETVMQASSESGTGIAGVVAQLSDVEENGCQECPFGVATLGLWRVDVPVVDGAAARLTMERQPDVTIEALEAYARELDAGHYLLCEHMSCIGVTVSEGERLTVNLKRRYGPTSFFVSASGFDEDFGIDVSE
jgi:hypothetical protein